MAVWLSVTPSPYDLAAYIPPHGCALNYDAAAWMDFRIVLVPDSDAGGRGRRVRFNAIELKSYATTRTAYRPSHFRILEGRT
jgi:hypothetical protein